MSTVKYIRYVDLPFDVESQKYLESKETEILLEYNTVTKETEIIGVDGRILTDRTYNKEQLGL